jgi:hypothetical protein
MRLETSACITESAESSAAKNFYVLDPGGVLLSISCGALILLGLHAFEF